MFVFLKFSLQKYRLKLCLLWPLAALSDLKSLLENTNKNISLLLRLGKFTRSALSLDIHYQPLHPATTSPAQSPVISAAAIHSQHSSRRQDRGADLYMRFNSSVSCFLCGKKNLI